VETRARGLSCAWTLSDFQCPLSTIIDILQIWSQSEFFEFSHIFQSWNNILKPRNQTLNWKYSWFNLTLNSNVKTRFFKFRVKFMVWILIRNQKFWKILGSRCFLLRDPLRLKAFHISRGALENSTFADQFVKTKKENTQKQKLFPLSPAIYFHKTAL
jgi:hypothetical protein